MTQIDFEKRKEVPTCDWRAWLLAEQVHGKYAYIWASGVERNPHDLCDHKRNICLLKPPARNILLPNAYLAKELERT